MATVVENIALIRQRLRNPDPHRPTDAEILNILIEHIYDHHAQLQNTANHWSIGWTTLTTIPGNEDYLITAADFGRPFLVYTDDPTNDFHQRREVPFTLLQDAEQRYTGPEKSGAAGSNTHSAVEISFYRRSPSAPATFARLTPIPNEA